MKILIVHEEEFIARKLLVMQFSPLFRNSRCYQGYIFEYIKAVTNVRIEVFIAVTMKNDVILDVTPSGSSKYHHFGGTYHLHHQD
jgi:hypothetical protein